MLFLNFFRILGENHLVSFGEPVMFWLRELSLVHEAECTIMLQSKPVDPGNFSGRATSFSSNSSLLELGHLENIKPYKMETGKIYLWIRHSSFFSRWDHIWKNMAVTHLTYYTKTFRRRWHGKSYNSFQLRVNR